MLFATSGRPRLSRRRVERLGNPAVMRDLLLLPEKLVRFGHELTVDGLPEFRRSVGLDAGQG